MPDLPWLLIVRFGACLAFGCVATWIDLRERRIPNWLTISLLVLGLVTRGICEQWAGLWDALLGFGVGFAIFFVLFLSSGAAGDVKFMAAVGVWLGPYHTFMVIVLSAILLLVCMFVLLVYRLIFAPRTPGSGPAPDLRTKLLKQIVPYALPATLAILLRLGQLLLIEATKHTSH